MLRDSSLLGLILAISLVNGSVDADRTNSIPMNRVLKSISEIRASALQAKSTTPPVEVSAQILRSNPKEQGTFLFDGSEGIYMLNRENLEIFTHLKVGDWVDVKGYAEESDFTSLIVPRQIEVIGNKPLPEPRPFLTDERYLWSSDCQWVSIRGRLISVSPDQNHEYIILTLEEGDSLLDVQIPYSEKGIQRSSEIMFRKVQLNAVAGTLFNNQRQANGRIFIVNSIDDLRLIDFQEEEGAQAVMIHELMNASMDHRKMVRTYGVVTGVNNKELFLRGKESSLKAQLVEPIEISPGQYVELLGYVWPQPISPAFRARFVELVNEQEIPIPIKLVADEAIDPKMQYELIEIDARLMDVGKAFDPSGEEQQILQCRAGGNLFESRLPFGIQIEDNVQPGAMLRLNGICHLIRNPHMRGILIVDGFWLQLLSAEGIDVIASTPWWTPRRLIWALSSSIGVLLLMLIWAALLRRTVDRQTRVIGDQLEREAILDERQRIARELHDNLEQGLAGMAIQLIGCLRQQELITEEQLNAVHDETLAKQIREDAVKNKAAIGIVQDMLTHCSEESRSAILDLRGGLLERMDLVSALKETLEPLAEECGTELELSVEGLNRRLERAIERNLLLIAKEAVSNAIRHASPQTIIVKLNYTEEDIGMSVMDDGCGFDTQKLSSSSRFGVQGIRERVKNLDGRFEINSTVGAGTSVQVTVPLKGVLCEQ